MVNGIFKYKKDKKSKSPIVQNSSFFSRFDGGSNNDLSKDKSVAAAISGLIESYRPFKYRMNEIIKFYCFCFCCRSRHHLHKRINLLKKHRLLISAEKKFAHTFDIVNMFKLLKSMELF